MRHNLVFIGLMITMMIVPVIVTDTQARQFRFITPIASPQEPNAQLPAGAIPVENVRSLSRKDLTTYVEEVVKEWNTNGMPDTLSDSFYDKSRLLDVVVGDVPRDATLRIQGVQSIQTLEQYIIPGNGTERGELVSIVTVTVRAQLEFNSATDGFVRLQGTNELLLEVVQAAPP